MRPGLFLLCAIGLAFVSSPPNAQAATYKGNQPLLALTGRKSKVLAPGYHRIETAEAWKALWMRHQTGKSKPDTAPENLHHVDVDFDRCIVIAVFQGDGSSCEGYEVDSIQESASRILVRVRAHHVQTGQGYVHESEAWGVFVIPRSRKPVVVELDTRSLIRSPPKWTKVADLPPGNRSIEE
jgi:hypothetical protein